MDAFYKSLYFVHAYDANENLEAQIPSNMQYSKTHYRWAAVVIWA